MVIIHIMVVVEYTLAATAAHILVTNYCILPVVAETVPNINLLLLATQSLHILILDTQYCFHRMLDYLTLQKRYQCHQLLGRLLFSCSRRKLRCKRRRRKLSCRWLEHRMILYCGNDSEGHECLWLFGSQVSDSIQNFDCFGPSSLHRNKPSPN